MKVYWLSPADGQSWLSPPEVVERWRECFPRVAADADAARARGERFMRKYRELEAAGVGRDPTPVDVMERRWSGALLVEVWADADGAARFGALVCTDYCLQLEFGRGVPPRR